MIVAVPLPTEILELRPATDDDVTIVVLPGQEPPIVHRECIANGGAVEGTLSARDRDARCGVAGDKELLPFKSPGRENDAIVNQAACSVSIGRGVVEAEDVPIGVGRAQPRHGAGQTLHNLIVHQALIALVPWM